MSKEGNIENENIYQNTDRDKYENDKPSTVQIEPSVQTTVNVSKAQLISEPESDERLLKINQVSPDGDEKDKKEKEKA